MDIEKTLRAIAESQLRAERRMDLADKRADRADQRADRADERADRADKRMDRMELQLRTTRDLVRAGVKMVLDMGKTQAGMKKDLDYKFNALMDAQARTDEKFNRLIETLRHKNGNGNK